MGSGTIASNLSKELGSTHCSMQVLERLDFYVTLCKQFKFLVFDNIKKVFRRFAFIQANILFLKLKRILTKVDISCVKSKCQSTMPTHPIASI